jgi:alpha-glucosidase
MGLDWIYLMCCLKIHSSIIIQDLLNSFLRKKTLLVFFKNRFTILTCRKQSFCQTLKALCAQYGEKLLLGEVTGPVSDTKSFLGTPSKPGLDLVFSFEMLRFNFSATYFYVLVEKMETHFVAPLLPVYTFNNHDRRRSFTRLKAAPQKAALLAAFLLTVRGVPSLYYGEEIGMEDLPLPYKSALDPIPHKNAWLPRWLTELFNETLNRDDVRTPMQWNAAKNAGFSVANQTWLPVHPNFTKNNVAQQELDSQSILGHYKSLLKLRKANNALHAGSLRLFPETLKSGVLTYVRRYENQQCWVFLNFSEQKVDISAYTKNLMLLLGNVNAGKLAPRAYAIFEEEL